MTCPQVVFSTREGRLNGDLITYHLLINRYIFLTEPIDDKVAAEIEMQLMYLDCCCHDDIYLWIKSPGGSVSAGLSIIDCMKRLQSTVITICDGSAASMAAVIVACGQKRYITPMSEMMIHQPLGSASGQAVDIELTAQHISKVKNKLHLLLASKTKQTAEKIAIDCDRDLWLDAEKSIRYGLVDALLNEEVLYL